MLTNETPLPALLGSRNHNRRTDTLSRIWLFSSRLLHSVHPLTFVMTLNEMVVMLWRFIQDNIITINSIYLIFLITMVCWDMLSERIFGFGNLLAKLALVSWVGNVPGFNVLSEVGFPAALIRTVKTKPELSILVHFTLYFSFNIYKQQSLYSLCRQCLATWCLQVSLVLKVLLQFSQRYPEWATCRASTCSYKWDFLPVW